MLLNSPVLKYLHIGREKALQAYIRGKKVKQNNNQIFIITYPNFSRRVKSGIKKKTQTKTQTENMIFYKVHRICLLKMRPYHEQMLIQMQMKIEINDNREKRTSCCKLLNSPKVLRYRCVKNIVRGLPFRSYGRVFFERLKTQTGNSVAETEAVFFLQNDGRRCLKIGVDKRSEIAETKCSNFLKLDCL